MNLFETVERQTGVPTSLIPREPTGQSFYARRVRAKFQRYRRPTTMKRHEDGLLASRVLWLAGTTQWTQPPRVSLRLSCLFMVSGQRSVLQEAARNTSVRELFAKRTDDPGGWFAGDVVSPRVRFPDGHAPRSTLWREAATRAEVHPLAAGWLPRGWLSFFSSFANFSLVPSSSFLPSFHRYTATTTFVLTCSHGRAVGR